MAKSGLHSSEIFSAHFPRPRFCPQKYTPKLCSGLKRYGPFSGNSRKGVSDSIFHFVQVWWAWELPPIQRYSGEREGERQALPIKHESSFQAPHGFQCTFSCPTPRVLQPCSGFQQNPRPALHTNQELFLSSSLNTVPLLACCRKIPRFIGQNLLRWKELPCHWSKWQFLR